jgi:hypothetical protein
MKKLIKKPVLLLGSLGALISLGFVFSQSEEVKAQGSVEWCDWRDMPDYPDYDGCQLPIWHTPCICEDQC